MKTDNLIRALTSDLAPAGPSIEQRFATVLLPGVVVALILFALTLGPRPDFMAVKGDPRFIFKFVITLLLALCSAMLVWRLVRPGAPTRLQVTALAIVPIVLAAGVVAELVALPHALWEPRMIGVNGLVCLASIPFFALPMLIAAILALRHGAPIVPYVTAGSAEIFPVFALFKWRWWRRYSEWPGLPLATFPFLPLPLPSKWHIRFLPAMDLTQYGPEAADNAALVKEISAHVRREMQQAIDDILRRRSSIFYGSVFAREKASSAAKTT